MRGTSTQNRREFLQRTAASAAVLGLPTIVPASALGRDGHVAPSERIVMAAIGTGGMGRGNISGFMHESEVQMVAVCDVDVRHLEMARQLVNQHYDHQDCAAYHDFRELVERAGIDAVVISTPDHWHGLTSIAAANAGWDIYCEKPLANSVAEGRAICEAVERHGRVLQTGSHERSTNEARRGCELVRNGRIGRLHTIRILMPTDEGHHEQVRQLGEAPLPQPVPDGFDYNLWLGHAPWAPYHERRCHFWWRFILAYGGGEMTDRGAHIIDLAQLGAGKDDTGPVNVIAEGTRPTGSLYDAFMDYRFENHFADGLRMIGENQGPRGVRFEGEDGWLFIHVHGGRLEAEPASVLQETIGEDELQLGRSPGHRRNFLDSVKSRAQPLASAEIGHRTGTICHLNNIAMLTGRQLTWDPKSERIVNDDEAQALLQPAMRAPWSL